MVVQINNEVPKKGAINRPEAISAPMIVLPEMKAMNKR
jgi:hypothetical protein